MEKACPFSSRVRIPGQRQVKSLLPSVFLYACNCQPLKGYLWNFEVMSDKPVRTAISYSLTYIRRTIILTNVELPPLRGIYLPLVEVLFIDRLLLLYISDSAATVSVVITAVVIIIIISGAVIVMIITMWP